MTTSELSTCKLLYLKQKQMDLNIKTDIGKTNKVQKKIFLFRLAVLPLQLIEEVFA